MIQFSVLINNYNYARFLPEALASVVAQSVAPHEIIVVDDGSSDDSIKVLQGLSAKIPSLRIHAQPNGGQLSALRAGVRLATGDWCVFLDADDTWEPIHLQAVAEAISNDPDLGLYYSGHRESSGPPVFRSKWPHGSVGPCAGLVAARGIRIGTITSALCLKKEYAVKAVDLDESFDLEWRTRADDCLVFGASIAGAIIHYNPLQSVNYRVHGGNTFANKFQDSYMVYKYELQKWRLLLRYSEKFGIRRDDLFNLLVWEFQTFSRNRSHPYYRARFARELRKSSGPLTSKFKVLLRWIRNK